MEEGAENMLAKMSFLRGNEFPGIWKSEVGSQKKSSPRAPCERRALSLFTSLELMNAATHVVQSDLEMGLEGETERDIDDSS